MENREITSVDLDMLQEIGNIGSGSAATALSSMINKTVLIEVPGVKLVKIFEISSTIGNDEDIKTGIFININGTLNGFIILLLDDCDALMLNDLIVNIYGSGVDQEAILSEIGNIISGSYISAIASMINGTINLAPPILGHDMLCSLLDGFVSAICAVADSTVVIENDLIIDDKKIGCSSLLLLETDSLNKLLDYFKF